MIPFARLLKYGNVIQDLEIKNVVGGALSAFILYSDGRLFGAGSNLNGELGLGNYTGWNGNTPKWTLVDTGVSEVYGGPFAVGVVYKKNDEYYYRGKGTALGLSGYTYSAMSLNTKTLLPSGCTVKKIVQSTNGIMFLITTSTGEDYVYGVGSGNLMGQGTNQNRYSLTQLSGISTTGIKDIGINDSAFYYLSSSGDMYGTGTNAESQLSTSAIGTIHLTFLLQSSSVKTMSIGNNNYIAQLTSPSPLSLYGRGQNNLYCISPSSTTRYSTFSILSSGLSSSDCKLVSSGSYASGYINDNSMMYAIGNSVSSLASGTTGAVNVYTRFMSSITDFSNYSTSYNNAFFGSGKKWYMITQSSNTGITGTLQPNGTYLVPLDLK